MSYKYSSSSSYSSDLSSYSSTAPADDGFGVIWLIVISLFMLISFIVSVAMFTDAAAEKGHNVAARMVALTIFCTPIGAGLYAAALPDVKIRNVKKDASKTVQSQPTQPPPQSQPIQQPPPQPAPQPQAIQPQQYNPYAAPQGQPVPYPVQPQPYQGRYY